MFLSDPQKLLLGDKSPNPAHIAKSLTSKGVRTALIHSSYLISDATKGYQKALLKQELHAASTLAALGISVPAYVVHLHSKSVEIAVTRADNSALVAFENTSRVVHPSAY